MARNADIHVYVTREGKVRARIDVGTMRIRTAPRATATETAVDIGLWLESHIDTEWPAEEGDPNA